jgi:hypothetical protein
LHRRTIRATTIIIDQQCPSTVMLTDSPATLAHHPSYGVGLCESGFMQTNWFIIIRARGAWWIDNEGTEYGPFISKRQAGTEALTIARIFGDGARRSRVYVPDDDGKHQLIWEGA